MTENDLNELERYNAESEFATWDNDFLRRNGIRVTAVIRRASLSTEDAIKEIRRLRTLVNQVKALAWGDHPEAGDDPAAIREYLRDLLVNEPDGAGDRDDARTDSPIRYGDNLPDELWEWGHTYFDGVPASNYCRITINSRNPRIEIVCPNKQYCDNDVVLLLRRLGPDRAPVRLYAGRCLGCNRVYYAEPLPKVSHPCPT